MAHELEFYVDGAWVAPSSDRRLDVIDPASEEPCATIALGSQEDVDRAVAAAKRAFATFSQTTKEERLALLRRIRDEYVKRKDDLVEAVTSEMGAPLGFARDEQVFIGEAHLNSTIEAFERFAFDQMRGSTLVTMEPIGVAGLITPWNWPLNQIVCKVAPAIAAGCTMVLKPSEIAPLSAIVFSEIVDAAGAPKGVYNMVQGDGPTVGRALSTHEDVDVMSFTGSTVAGIDVAKSSADTVKRVLQELGGKSPNVILDDADLESAVTTGVQFCFGNTGQSCDAPTRMLVPRARMKEAVAIAAAEAERTVTGDPRAEGTGLGPLVSERQFEKVQALIQKGVDEGATLAAGGVGKPEGLEKGYYVKPTIFGDVAPDMTIAKEEIFGPVLAIIPYDTEEEAVQIANDTPYGLAAYVQSGDLERARKIARKLRAGTINLNYPDWDAHAPFGGFKQSGNGREYSDFAIHDFLEIKGVVGHGAA